VEPWQLASKLAEAENYVVYDAEGQRVGRLDHVRYRHHADHPDIAVIRRRNLLRRSWSSVPFAAIEDVDSRSRAVVLNILGESVRFSRAISA
jgi:hypothetical protein